MTAPFHVSNDSHRRLLNIHNIQLPSKLSECKNLDQKIDYFARVIRGNPTLEDLSKLFQEISLEKNLEQRNSLFMGVLWGLYELLNKNASSEFSKEAFKSFEESFKDKKEEFNQYTTIFSKNTQIPESARQGYCDLNGCHLIEISDSRRLMNFLLTTSPNSKDYFDKLTALQTQLDQKGKTWKLIDGAIKNKAHSSLSKVILFLQNGALRIESSSVDQVESFNRSISKELVQPNTDFQEKILRSMEKDSDNRSKKSLGCSFNKYQQGRSQNLKNFVSVMNAVTTQLAQREADAQKLVVAGQMSQIGMNKGQSPLMAAHQKELQTLLVRMDNVLTELMHFVERMDSKNALIAGIRELKEGAEALRHKTDLNFKDWNQFKNTFAFLQKQIRASWIG